ncbi:MAG TPA: PAS domain S-box protein, partial [Acidimicrobiia bacterium]|nr:PAS domain S-box protein [Acidimicrobiia bacterium]
MADPGSTGPVDAGTRASALRRRAEFFDAMVEASPDGMVLVDREGSIAFANGEAAALFGYADLVGVSVDNLVPDGVRDVHAGHRSRYQADPVRRPMGTGLELSGRRADGSTFPIDISLAPVVFGNEPYVLATVRDITRRRAAEQAAAHLRFIVENSDDAIFGLDAEGRITSWNRGAERLLGWSAPEAVGRRYTDVFHESEVSDEEEVLARVLTGETVDRRHATLVREGGMAIPVELTVSPVRDSANAVVGAAVMGRDLTEQQLAQRTLAEASARLQEAQGLAQFGMFAWDRASDTVQMSEELYRLLGTDPNRFSAERSDLLALVQHPFRIRLEDAFDAAVSDGRPIDLEVAVTQPETGETRWMLVRGETALDAGGAPMGVSGVFQDVTERRMAADALQLAFEREHQAAERLREADRLKDDFLALVSHELRTPLASVIGFGEMLLNGEQFTEEARRDFAARIVNNADEMHQMIERVLDFSRLSSGRIQIAAEDVPLDDAIEAIVARHRSALTPFVVDVDVDEGLSVRADANALRSIVGNLLTNAAKFSPPESTIRVEAWARETNDGDTEVVLAVSDHGPGIPVEIRERVFERFFQGPDQPIGKRGTGVGLAIVKRYVELLGGSAWVEGADGGGTTFFVT